MADQRPYSLTHATVVTPTEVLPNTDLTVADGHFVQAEPSTNSSTDLRGYLVFPALINAHDHLGGTWWPRVGPSRPYPSVYPWLDELHASPVRAERQLNTDADVYELGMYRCLFSGVATVADHLWRIDGAEFYERFPIEVMYKYGRTWTVREPTAWGADIPTEYALAVRTGQPYIIHLAEGLDPETAQEMDLLLAAGALGRNTLIVHGIGLRPSDIQAMAAVDASLCWCPGSNLYLYEQTADLPVLTHAGINITLGTDSSLSGELNLLEELRTARRYLADRVDQLALKGRSIEQWLVEAVTTRAAYALDAPGTLWAHRARIPRRPARAARPRPGSLYDLDRGANERHRPALPGRRARLWRRNALSRSLSSTPRTIAGSTFATPRHTTRPPNPRPNSWPETRSPWSDVCLETVGRPLDLPFLPLSINEEQTPCPAS